MGDPIALASDHRGFALKQALRRHLEECGLEIRDVGTSSTEAVDYPDFAAPAARAVSRGEASRAIVICGTGLGVMYTANRFPRVRAALVHDVETAALARQHNDANVLALSGDRIDPDAAWEIVQVFLHLLDARDGYFFAPFQERGKLTAQIGHERGRHHRQRHARKKDLRGFGGEKAQPAGGQKKDESELSAL